MRFFEGDNNRSKLYRVFTSLLCLVTLAALMAMPVFAQDLPENPTMDQDPGDPEQGVSWVRFNFEEGA